MIKKKRKTKASKIQHLKLVTGSLKNEIRILDQQIAKVQAQKNKIAEKLRLANAELEELQEVTVVTAFERDGL